MKNYTRLLLTIGLVLVAGRVSAASWDNGGVITTIQAITVLQNGNFYLRTNDDLCDAGTVNRVAYVYEGLEPAGIKQVPEGVNRMLSLAITAKARDTKVKIFADDSGSFYGCRMGAIQMID